MAITQTSENNAIIITSQRHPKPISRRYNPSTAQSPHQQPSKTLIINMARVKPASRLPMKRAAPISWPNNITISTSRTPRFQAPLATKQHRRRDPARKKQRRAHLHQKRKETRRQARANKKAARLRERGLTGNVFNLSHPPIHPNINNMLTSLQRTTSTGLNSSKTGTPTPACA